jgi:endogenous inhibitor of DNA gyrase (YacG/DUF329 family)
VKPIPCPTCKRPVAWGPESPFRPFCSERCRLVDLGAWFSGERAIPAEEGPDEGDRTVAQEGDQ